MYITIHATTFYFILGIIVGVIGIILIAFAIDYVDTKRKKELISRLIDIDKKGNNNDV